MSKYTDTQLEEAAHTLIRALPLHDNGYVAIGADRLHVHINGPRNRWLGPIPSKQNDIPVRWHFGGKVRPLNISA